MMDRKSTPMFRFNFAAPVSDELEPQQRLDKLELVLGDDNESETLLPPPLEVFPSEVDASAPFPTDPVVFQDGLTLLKRKWTRNVYQQFNNVEGIQKVGKVSAAKVIGVGKSDLVPGKYEGGLKLWECAIDLVNSMMQEIKDRQLSFEGKRVLELGCGHGLPGIFTTLKGASTVHLQDFNAEVLRSVTIPNVIANIKDAPLRTNINGVLSESGLSAVDIRYYAGDWGNVHELLSVAAHGHSPCPHGYDVILMSETVYSLPSLPKLYNLIKKCLKSPDGVLFVAGKKHYFGVGGGTRQFKTLVDEDGVMQGHLVTDLADGSSNIREIWKFFFK